MTTPNNKRSYEELKEFSTFAERFEYLKLSGGVGSETFGSDRYLNQLLYRSEEWKRFRRQILLRDNGCDLGLEDRPLVDGRITIHHLNPITKQQILSRDPVIFDPDNAISCSHNTHLAIHYGSLSNVDMQVVRRIPNDTCPWRR